MEEMKNWFLIQKILTRIAFLVFLATAFYYLLFKEYNIAIAYFLATITTELHLILNEICLKNKD